MSQENSTIVAPGHTIPTSARAAVYAKVGTSQIDIKDQPIPTLGDGEILVKLSHSGVCHSDLHIMLNEWKWCPGCDGQVGGHEGVGTVVAAHSSVPSSFLNTRVGIKWIRSACLSCHNCLAGKETSCPSAKVSGGFGQPGTFQEYVVTAANYCTPIPKDLDGKLAAPLLCAGVTVYRALKVLSLPFASWVAIPGAGGGLGHLAIQYARALGYRVVAIDAANKRTLCESLGASAFIDFVDAGDKLADRVREATDGFGAHAVVVVNASEQSYQQAPSLVRVGGQVMCVGIPAKQAPIPIDAQTVILRDISIRGSAVGTRLEAIEALDFAARGHVKPFVETIKLEGLQDAMERMKKGEIAGRVVIEL